MDTRIKESPSPLFDGIRPEDRQLMLGCIGYHLRAYRKGEIIVFEEEPVRYVGLLLSGAVDMVKEDLWGGKTLLLRSALCGEKGHGAGRKADPPAGGDCFAGWDCHRVRKVDKTPAFRDEQVQ